MLDVSIKKNVKSSWVPVLPNEGLVHKKLRFPNDVICSRCLKTLPNFLKNTQWINNDLVWYQIREKSQVVLANLKKKVSGMCQSYRSYYNAESMEMYTSCP